MGSNKRKQRSVCCNGKYFFEPGDRSNKLLVLERVGFGAFNRYRCVCECGKEVVLTGTKVHHNLSCGCARIAATIRTGKANRLKDGNSIINAIIRLYKTHAVKRGYAWDLTYENVVSLLYSECYYCGDPASNAYKGDGETIFYNGIDRIDNADGYTPSNTVPCCIFCNRAKNKYALSDFYRKIRLIHMKMESRGIFPDVTSPIAIMS